MYISWIKYLKNLYASDKICAIIVGLVTGYFVMRYFKPSIIYHGPDSNKIRKELYIDKNSLQCYRFVPQVHFCPLGFNRMSKNVDLL